MDTASMYMNSKNIKGYLKTQQLEDITEDDNTIEETFPWLPKFTKTICSIGSRNYQHLEQLLLLYTQNILPSVAASNVKFKDAIILKNHVNNMLTFFHLYWLDIKQDIADHSSYLNKMSALLNVYIDMELKTSMEKRTSIHIRDSSKIAAKILAALYICLNNSEEHIFRVLLRIKYTTEKYTKICNHIFMYVNIFSNMLRYNKQIYKCLIARRKSFTNLKTKTTSVNDIAYIRYLLAFKIWKKMEETSDKKDKINKLALMLLGSRMPKLREALLEFVPRPPKGQENETLWLLQPNLDLKQAHKHFLLFEDKMDNLADVQCTKISYTDQSCSKSQKHQMNLLCRRSNSNGDTSYKLINKDCLSGLKNNNMLKNINLDKSVDQTYLQKKGTKSLKPLKKIRKKPGKTVIIDLTGDDEISVPCKMKRRKSKRNVECLKMMKNIMKNKKHINPWKCSSVLVCTDTKESSNKDSKSSVERVHSKCKSISDNKITENYRKSTENSTLISNKSSLNDVRHINLQKNEHLSITKNQMSNVCPEFAKKDKRQHEYNTYYLKLPMFVDQNIKDVKTTTNVLKESKPENRVSSHVTYATRNQVNSCSNPITQNKEASAFQEESIMETIPLSKMCQNNIADKHSFKQELPTSMNCNAMQKSHKCCETMPVDVHDIKHLIIKKLKSINDHSSQITEIIKQKVCHQVNECPNCCTKIDCKPFVFTNNDITAAKETLHNDNENDVKLACDTKNIIYMLSDRNKCVYIVNHVDEHVMTVHAEKRMQCLDKSNDTCTVSTTFTEDQIVESPLYSQHVNFDNVRMNDYDNAAKYSEATLKEQQKGSNCNPSILNDRVHSSESCIFDINSFEIGSNAEVDYDLKNFPKIEEADEITKTDCIGDLEHVSFLNNIQSETLEDFLRQFSEMPQINYDSSTSVPTKKPLVYTDNSITPVKTQDTLHNMFNDDENGVKSSCNTNIIYMLSDRDKCVYVTNNTGERVMTTSAEKKEQGLDNSNDICTVSTTFTDDQIVGSLNGQHVNFDNRKKCDYGDGSKYSEATMKEQQGESDCDTSLSNNRLHPSELCTFDIDSFDMDSKKTNEIMKIDCIDDFENIGFIHNIQTETLEDVLSNDTTDFFLPLKQPPFELDNVYTDTLLNEKDIMCNNQNDTIDSSLDPIAFHINTDNTFLRLPAKSDKSTPVNRNKFQHNVKHFC